MVKTELDKMIFVTNKIAVGHSQDVLNTKEHILRDAGITGVLNVAFDLECPQYNEIEALHCGLIAGPGNKVEAFRLAVDSGDRMLGHHEKIIVHCHSGRERSPLVAAAIICKMSEYRRPVMSCYEMVRAKLSEAGRPARWVTDGAKKHLPVLAEMWYEMAKNGAFVDAKSANNMAVRENLKEGSRLLGQIK